MWVVFQFTCQIYTNNPINAQMILVKDDWIHQIESDLEDLGIEFDENQIKNTKKAKFNQIVQERIRKSSHSHLLP